MSNGNGSQLAEVNLSSDENSRSIIAPLRGNVITNVQTSLPSGRARGPIIVNASAASMS